MTRSEAIKKGIAAARERNALAQGVNTQFRMFEIGMWAYSACTIGTNRREVKEYPYRILRGKGLEDRIEEQPYSSYATEYFATFEALHARAMEIINYVRGNISADEWADIELKRRLDLSDAEWADRERRSSWQS